MRLRYISIQKLKAAVPIFTSSVNSQFSLILSKKMIIPFKKAFMKFFYYYFKKIKNFEAGLYLFNYSVSVKSRDYTMEIIGSKALIKLKEIFSKSLTPLYLYKVLNGEFIYLLNQPHPFQLVG